MHVKFRENSNNYLSLRIQDGMLNECHISYLLQDKMSIILFMQLLKSASLVDSYILFIRLRIEIFLII